MVPRKQGLIVFVSSPGGLRYLFNTAYGVGKAAVNDRLTCEGDPRFASLRLVWSNGCWYGLRTAQTKCCLYLPVAGPCHHGHDSSIGPWCWGNDLTFSKYFIASLLLAVYQTIRKYWENWISAVSRSNHRAFDAKSVFLTFRMNRRNRCLMG